jgi:hypothetical protein
MPYSNFTIGKVEKDFQLNVVTGVFFPEFPLVPPSQWLADLLQQTIPFATAVGTEKARSEFVIAPLLFELLQSLHSEISLFSGRDFTVAPELGLNGICDFMITRSQDEISIKAPAIVIIEAKKGELDVGWGQPATQGSEETSEQSVAVCAAEMVAAQRFNQENDSVVPNIYGSVTTGTRWQFLRLTGQQLTIDLVEYSLEPLDRMLGILNWMVKN